MSLDADQIVERRRLKRSRALWRFTAVVAAVGMVMTTLVTFGVPKLAFSHVARLKIEGIILDDRRVLDAIEAIEKDGSAAAVIVAIDSPGGTVTGSEAIYTALRRVSEKKPVVATMGALAASGGYLVALSADHIVAQRNTITGSVGVILQTTEISGLLDKVGVSVSEIKSGPLKAEPSMFKPLSEDARKATEALVMDAHQWFLGLVKERRGLSAELAAGVGDGRVFSGQQALEAKLVDAVGDEAAARAWLKNSHKVSESLPIWEVDPYGQPAGFGMSEGGMLSLLLTVLTGKTLKSEPLTLDGLVAIWHPQH